MNQVKKNRGTLQCPKVTGTHYIYNILGLSDGGDPFYPSVLSSIHPSSSSRKKKMMEEEDDEWWQQ
jgi:hypothetical protein